MAILLLKGSAMPEDGDQAGEAYMEGYEDGRRGNYDNPYPEGTDCYYAYEDGFDEGNEEYNEGEWDDIL